MKIRIISILLFCCCKKGITQATHLIFQLKDETTSSLIHKAYASIASENLKLHEKPYGTYELMGNLKVGEYTVTFSHTDYEHTKMKVIIGKEKNNIDLGTLYLKPLYKTVHTEFTLIDNLDDLLNEDQQSQSLLSSGKDQFSNSIAFQWRGAFFRPRGLDSKENTILINGITMNSFFNSRFAWGTINGLNAMMKNQESTLYMAANPYAFGGIQGVNAFQFEAHKFRKGAYTSLSSTNSTYQGRLITHYNTGIMKNGWAFSGLLSGTYAKQGYIEGTTFRHVGGLFSVSKKISDRHQLNFTSYYTPNSRGRNAPLTNEVIDLKGRQYNPYWGKQDNKVRNSSIRTISAPTLTLNHTWQPSSSFEIQNNLLFQQHKTANSRIEFNGKSLSSDGQTFTGTSLNPDPTYYQRLPSNFLQSGQQDFEKAFLAQQDFIEDGQLDWKALYQRNQELPLSAFIVYNDINEDRVMAINSLGQLQIIANTSLQYKLAYQKYDSNNHAEVIDLLGGNGYLDIDAFETGSRAQNDLKNPNRIVGVGDTFRYNYAIEADRITSFTQVDYTRKKWNAFTGLEFQHFSATRSGLYQNGVFPNNSIGKSNTYSTFTSKIKAGVTYNLNNKLYLQFHGLYGTTPHPIRNIFVNPRQHNQLTENLKSLNQLSTDFSLKYQYKKWRARLSAYHIDQRDDASIRFFFTENISGLGREDNSDFVQQVITGIHTRRQGLELGLNYELTNTLTINAAAAYGKHWYADNANLKLFTDLVENGIDFEEVHLKNYRLPNGPQQAYGLGFTYRDPKFWWFNTQLNFFNDIYISVAEFLRTDAFATDVDGQPIIDYNEARARELLQQEQLPNYFLWNATGGKSWKIDNYYIGFTLGIQNILDTFYRTGGFQQGRLGNYTTLNEESKQQHPLFGNKYWVGRGTTYYLNMYLRF